MNLDLRPKSSCCLHNIFVGDTFTAVSLGLKIVFKRNLHIRLQDDRTLMIFTVLFTWRHFNDIDIYGFLIVFVPHIYVYSRSTYLLIWFCVFVNREYFLCVLFTVALLFGIPDAVFTKYFSGDPLCHDLSPFSSRLSNRWFR